MGTVHKLQPSAKLQSAIARIKEERDWNMANWSRYLAMAEEAFYAGNVRGESHWFLRANMYLERANSLSEWLMSSEWEETRALMPVRTFEEASRINPQQTRPPLSVVPFRPRQSIWARIKTRLKLF